MVSRRRNCNVKENTHHRLLDMTFDGSLNSFTARSGERFTRIREDDKRNRDFAGARVWATNYPNIANIFALKEMALKLSRADLETLMRRGEE